MSATAAPIIRSFMRRFRSEILAEWRSIARRVIPAAETLTPLVLIDHIPEMLEEIADIADEIAARRPDSSVFATARRHALDRLGEGFGVSAVVKELSILRDCTMRVWERDHATGNVSDLRALNLAIDQAIEASVSRFAEARERSLAGMDRIATATLESGSVDELLARLLAVFRDTTPAVDTAAIMLVDGELLRVRAAVGLEQELDEQFALRFGEGFVGTIAAQRRPMELRSAYTDPLVKSDAIHRRGVRALYGVPLIHAGNVIGVAHMGSCSAHEFSHDDRYFFDSLIARATVGIVHQLLRADLLAAQAHAEELASQRAITLAKLESLFAASPVGIAFVDLDLRYLKVNEALATINGVSVDGHIGRTVAEVLPQFADVLEELLRGVIATGQPEVNVEIAPTTTGGKERRWLLANFFPVRSETGAIFGVGGLVIDVSDARMAQEALRLEKLLLQSIVEHAPAAIWIKDHEGKIVLANHQVGEALGRPHLDVLGKRAEDILPVDIANLHDEHDATVLRENRAIEVEETATMPAGTRTFLSIKFPIPGDPPLLGGIATEITQRKRMEEELRDAVRLREDLLAVVSHDLRTPLGTVQMSTALLMSQLVNDHRVRSHLEMISRSCVRMEHLIDDLLDTASIRVGRFQVDLQPEVVDEVLTEAIDLQSPIAAERGIALCCEQLPGVTVVCDRDRILQVFGNLIGNAIKFCRAGDAITVTGECADDSVTFRVRDTGPGIAPDVAPHLFEPYWSGPKHGTQGAGLGLFIVRGIVESHGGRVWVESTPGDGARFSFTLPARR